MHLLALALGEPNIEALELSMTEQQLGDWMRFYRSNPWGPSMDWTRHGMLMSMIANTAPNRRKGSRPAKPEEFMPKQPDKQITDRRARRIAFREMFGDKVKVPGEKRKPDEN